MTTLNLNTYFSNHVFAFVMVFSRIGTMMMLFPGIGEAYVPTRVRLMLAFSITALLSGVMLPRLPAIPSGIPALTLLLGYEVLIGLFFGTMLRILISSLETAGTMLGIQTGLSNATILNPALATQSTLPSAMLGVLGITCIFVTGLDHFLFRCMVSIYDIFPPGGEWMPGDMAQTVIQLTTRSFLVGMELSAPFLVMGLLMYLALGLIQKLMPQLQLFLVALPLQVWGGLTLMAITVSGIMAAWLHYFDSSLALFVAP